MIESTSTSRLANSLELTAPETTSVTGRLTRTAWILGSIALLLVVAFDLGPPLAFNDDWGMAWDVRHFNPLHISMYPSDSALALVNRTPGVKDVVSDIQVSPVSIFDDDIRIRALRAIYRDRVLSRYASDPAAPIRIVVINGKLSLYGTVENTMDKQLAGLRANQIPGVFSVANNLIVTKHS